MTPESCPRCGASPLEIRHFGEQVPRHLRACTCYPHPPRCVSCGTDLDERGYCHNGMCPTPYVVQPEPATDPLYEPDLHGDVR